jgi:hypothetical protein
VVHALQRIRTALEAEGVLVDTQPVSPHPQVAAAGRPIGYLDMREWLMTIEAVDALVGQTVEARLYSIEQEQRFTSPTAGKAARNAPRRSPDGKVRGCQMG